jgi:2-polyprenyl-3-methyl-5-hydroxy-6-metoxy-1,4-benzoquinol methylase
MPQDRSEIVEANRAQKISERDAFTEDRYLQFYSHLPAVAKKVLDVGCGIGRGGAALKSCDAGLELTGLDCVPERIAALDKGIFLGGLCAFTTDIPVESGCYDAVVAGEFLEHVPPVQVEATLAEFFRILRLRGRLLLTTPNPNYLKNKFKNLSVLQDRSHQTQHYPDCLAYRLRLAGFSRIKTFGSGKVTRLLGQHFPWLSVYGSYLISGDKW